MHRHDCPQFNGGVHRPIALVYKSGGVCPRIIAEIGHRGFRPSMALQIQRVDRYALGTTAQTKKPETAEISS